ncbi:MAG: hypothetical protein HYW23_04000 [Candidatus Aenigmarchaeota archaeon]|nr:hypothetical protein [Candidatus Aenigmarchaeota archaeon]
MTWKGCIIEESLTDSSLLFGIKVIRTVIEENAEGKETIVWNIHTVEVYNKEIDKVAEKLERNLKLGWYAHFTDGHDLLIIFANKSFTIGLEKVGEEKETGITNFKANSKGKGVWKSAFEYGTEIAKVDPKYMLKVE